MAEDVSTILVVSDTHGPVSYTHLDVYKRQARPSAMTKRSAKDIPNHSPVCDAAGGKDEKKRDLSRPAVQGKR